MWVTAVYHQVSLFSLKPADATSTAGRSLLVPTPFSIKMALLDMALRLYGVDAGAINFPLIRDLPIALAPPPRVVVSNCFMRIHKPRREKSGQAPADNENEDLGEGPFIRTVAFREYVQYSGPLGIAVQVESQQDASTLSLLLAQVSYLGKRGSFFQIDGPPFMRERLPTEQGYLRLDAAETDSESLGRSYTLQVLDDCGSSLTFQQANIYSGEGIALDKGRILRQVMLPYRLTHSSKGFSLYQRMDLPAG
jgi:hypothetical protein